jgi:hypothetical protein
MITFTFDKGLKHCRKTFRRALPFVTLVDILFATLQVFTSFRNKGFMVGDRVLMFDRDVQFGIAREQLLIVVVAHGLVTQWVILREVS